MSNPIRPSEKKKVAIINKIQEASDRMLKWDSMVISNKEGVHAIMVGTSEGVAQVREVLFGTNINPDQMN